MFDKKMTTSQHFSVIDNGALDSSMGSTQGLLSFMTNASRQIKTYLGPDDQHHKSLQNKNRQQQLLTQLKTQNFNFIPNILQSTQALSEICPESAPASPTPSLDSVGSFEEYETQVFRSSCLIKSRRQKRRRNTVTSSTYNDVMGKRARYPNPIQRQNAYFNCNTTSCAFVNPSSDSDYENIIPSPSPDFDDLVDCMLTEDDLANLDVNNYFPAL